MIRNAFANKTWVLLPVLDHGEYILHETNVCNSTARIYAADARKAKTQFTQIPTPATYMSKYVEIGKQKKDRQTQK